MGIFHPTSRCAEEGVLFLTYSTLTSNAHSKNLLQDTSAFPAPLDHCSLFLLPPLICIQEGVLFLTYSTLTSKAHGKSRMQQVEEWVGGKDFDGVLVFDEW